MLVQVFLNLATIVHVAAVLISRPYNVSLTDEDAVLQWTPQPITPNWGDQPDGLPDAAWNTTYSDQPWSTAPKRGVGLGYSSHVTWYSGAYVSVRFVGTGIYFWGVLADGGEVALTIDSKRRDNISPSSAMKLPGAPSNASLVASITGLDEGEHEAILTLVQGEIRLNNVTVTTVIQTEAKNASQSDTEDVYAVDQRSEELNHLFTTKGLWTQFTTVCAPSDPQPCPRNYPRIASTQPGASVSFMTNVGASLVQLYGMVDFNGSAYRVNMSPQPPNTNGDFKSVIANQFKAIDNMMFEAILDPNTSYKVTLYRDAPTNDNVTYINLYRVHYVFNTCNTCTAEQKNTEADVTQTPGTGTGSRNTVDKGAIAGGVVGGVVGLAIILLLVLFLLRRRRRKQESEFGQRYQTEPKLDAFPIHDSSQTPQRSPNYPYEPFPTSSADRSSFPLTGASGLAHTTTQGGGLSTGIPTDTSSSSKATYQPGESSEGFSEQPHAHRTAPHPIVEESEDAGRWVSTDDDSPVEYIPPRYNERWRTEAGREEFSRSDNATNSATT